MNTISLLLTAAMTGTLPAADPLRFQLENRFEVDVPAGAKSVHGWFALPSDRDALQTVENLKWSVDAPRGHHRRPRGDLATSRAIASCTWPPRTRPGRSSSS